MNSKRWIALGIAAGLFVFSAIMNVATSIAFGDMASL
jgi:protease-4